MKKDLECLTEMFEATGLIEVKFCKAACTMLNNEQTVKECDATGAK